MEVRSRIQTQFRYGCVGVAVTCLQGVPSSGRHPSRGDTGRPRCSEFRLGSCQECRRVLRASWDVCACAREVSSAALSAGSESSHWRATASVREKEGATALGTIHGSWEVPCNLGSDASSNVFPYLSPLSMWRASIETPRPLSSLLPSLHAGEDLPLMTGVGACPAPVSSTPCARRAN